MRTVQTFILRLLVDPAEPKALRGALQPLPEGEVQFFQDENALLALLRRHAAVLGAIAAQPIEPEEEASP
ncbi:MAG: hypothetical protein N2688_14340 [Burkholderiaceae bacterium]|nr:hypothetical protein [Burkholderiaceae bacterium]